MHSSFSPSTWINQPNSIFQIFQFEFISCWIANIYKLSVECLVIQKIRLFPKKIYLTFLRFHGFNYFYQPNHQIILHQFCPTCNCLNTKIKLDRMLFPTHKAPQQKKRWRSIIVQSKAQCIRNVLNEYLNESDVECDVSHIVVEFVGRIANLKLCFCNNNQLRW